tara:strand:- start:404 stop:1690 length:1287 start_codon:yes stop_codon:yes gene_type:complete
VIVSHTTIREYEYLTIASKSDNQQSITQQQADILRKVDTNLPPGTLSWGHNKVKFSQYCGVIQLGEHSIEILPKIFGLEDNQEASRDILIKMLFTAQKLLPRSYGSAEIRLQTHHLLDIFIAHFCDLLFEQIHRGLICIYKAVENNLGFIKGRLLLQQHIKYNVAHKEHVYCRYDELQIDNQYNQVIKATLRVLYLHAKNIRVRQQLNELIFIFSDISDISASSNDVIKLPRNRLVKRFEPIFQMCEWFLDGLSPDIYVGNKQALSLLFDMNKLFEAYISRMLRNVAFRQGLKLREQGPQRYLAQKMIDKKSIFLMKPDITLLDKDDKPRVLLDTKWKLLDSKDTKYGVNQADIYQIFAYAQQYECQNVVLIYPEHSNINDVSPIFKTVIGDVKIFIWTIDLTNLAKNDSDVSKQLSNRLSSLLTSSG